MRSESQIVHSPASGVVSSIFVSEGMSVLSSQNLVSILPSGSELEAHLYISPSQYTSIEKGQRVVIRYDAFPHNEYGYQQGVIRDIELNLILPGEDESVLMDVPTYRVKVAIPNQFLENRGFNHALRSGMRLNADIINDYVPLYYLFFRRLLKIQPDREDAS